MITSLQARNFKSWKDTGDLRLAPLTGLFGTNSSGKSSILQLLLMMKQTAEHPDSKRVLKLGPDFSGDERVYVDLRSFADLIHKHNNSSVLEFALSWNGVGLQWPVLENSNEVRFEAKIIEAQPTIVSEFTYNRGANEFGLRLKSNPGGYRREQYHLYNPQIALNSIESYVILPPPTHFYGFPKKVFDSYVDADFLSQLPSALEACLRSILYLGPMRTEPAALYLWAGSPPTDVGRRGESAVQALLASRGSDPRVEKQVAAWLKGLGLIESIKLQQLSENREFYEVRVKQTAESAEVSLPDVGFGISQILPVLVLCAYAEEGSILLIEQPEMHLHPSAQSELADVFIDAVKSRNLQIIIESHSEHFLRRLQRRIAEGKFSSLESAFYFCHTENGSSKADELKLTEDGYIKNWPKDFFGDEMGELAAMTEAAVGRKHRG